MKKIIVLSLLLIFAVGCKENGTSSEGDSIVGKWESTININDYNEGYIAKVDIVLEFNNDGSYFVYDLVERKEYINDEGTYSISNDSLTILSSKCPNIEGIFRVNFDANGFRIRTIRNDCESNSLIASWFKKFDNN